ncbi:DNA polymerase III subunit delta' [Pseudochelatococcus contaminans]|uniref:DNA polymerase-3 subunit delta n=1 Tax=Pseudochelatococcus contaminans TaxID=1538103 RepID=A0A7W5Z167_9HYPH|nr:DNA polymerase III subunit delta' [Pseudochelatococcus contaminans]MBB3808093.1 DNA polymerase-3 subunit delta' [Pseudochelatococcus contaminans]
MSTEAEPDQFPGAPHPRSHGALFGLEEAEREFLDAYRAGRLHHAWLIGGPQGIGKATFAYRAARFLLSHPDPQADAVRDARTLAVNPASGVSAKVAALSHPDLAVLRRAPATEKKAASTIIPVDAVRRALSLFASTAGNGGYRICIVDAVDDLNIASANALLKVIEEPPPRALFLLVAHSPGRTLATIRSRCRRMLLRALPEADVASAVRALPPPFGDVDEATLHKAASLSRGSVRTALGLLDPHTIALVERVRAMLERLPATDRAALHDLAESMTGREAEADFALLLSTVHDWVSEVIHKRAGQGAVHLARFVEVWENIARAARETQVLNLDRRPLVLSLFDDLADAVRHAHAA